MNMALSGLDIFKLLPKTNCGDCGIPTCMAFAMKLAQKKGDLSECPHASEEAKSKIGAASEPPIRLIKIGGSPHIELGNETVIFRHEKTFVHKTAIAIQLKTSESEESLESRIKEIGNYKIERVGEELTPDLFFITDDLPDKEKLFKIISSVKQFSTKGIILDCPDNGTLEEALPLVKSDRPSIFLSHTVDDVHIELAKNYNASLIISDKTFSGLAEQAEKILETGFKDIILNMVSNDIGNMIQNNTILRRSALKKNFKPFGFPLFTRIESKDNYDLLALASACLCKYSSIIVLPDFDKSLLYTLLTLRQNIYTDPQKPIQVDPKVYPIGEPTNESPVFVTTNFSLTYFIVSSEIENSGISAHLLVCDCEGQSVLTAWAAGKFSGKGIARYIKEINLEQTTKNRKIVIPGFVSQISGDLEEDLHNWEVIVGCQEASDIQAFVKNTKLL
jgi:acetyl-CoA decarbonylase/synthase, CODH/ACS complex subunit gamma